MIHLCCARHKCTEVLMRASSDGLLSLSEAQRILSCLDEPFKEPGMSLSLFIVLAGDFGELW